VSPTCSHLEPFRELGQKKGSHIVPLKKRHIDIFSNLKNPAAAKVISGETLDHRRRCYDLSLASKPYEEAFDVIMLRISWFQSDDGGNDLDGPLVTLVEVFHQLPTI
jgi:hypothetical protein